MVTLSYLLRTAEYCPEQYSENDESQIGQWFSQPAYVGMQVGSSAYYTDTPDYPLFNTYHTLIRYLPPQPYSGPHVSVRTENKVGRMTPTKKEIKFGLHTPGMGYAWPAGWCLSPFLLPIMQPASMEGWLFIEPACRSQEHRIRCTSVSTLSNRGSRGPSQGPTQVLTALANHKAFRASDFRVISTLWIELYTSSSSKRGRFPHSSAQVKHSIIMDDPQSLNWTLINEMAAALTQEQRDQAEVRIRDAGKVWMNSFKVSMAFTYANMG